jgi:hypothetical protein
MFKRLIKFIKSPIIRNCLTGKLMLNMNSTYIHINKIKGYVSEDLGYVINSCYVVDPKRIEELFDSYKFNYKSHGNIHRFRNVSN